jgi:hypothetical protein
MSNDEMRRFCVVGKGGVTRVVVAPLMSLLFWLPLLPSLLGSFSTPPSFLIYAWTSSITAKVYHSSSFLRTAKIHCDIAPELDPTLVAQVHHWVSTALGDKDDADESQNDMTKDTVKTHKKDDRYATVRALVATNHPDDRVTADPLTVKNNHPHQLVYGELSIPVLAKILDAVGVQPNDRFLDIGSGDGGLVYGAAMLYPPEYLTKVRGIELIPGLVERSQNHGRTLQQSLLSKDDKDNDEIDGMIASLDRTEFTLGNIYEAESDWNVQQILQDTTLAICFATTWSQGNNKQPSNTTAIHNNISLNRRQIPQLSHALQYLPPGARIVVVDGRLDDTHENQYEWKGDLRIQCPDTAPYSVASLYKRRHQDTQQLESTIGTPNLVSDTTVVAPPPPPVATSRRHVLSTAATALMAAATSSTAFPYQPAWAAVATTTTATCDRTVSVWQRGNRLIYLLGTAHISEQSATLAGQLVRDTHPGAVFVELDLRRVAGVSSRDMVVDNKTGIVSTRLALNVNDEAGSRVVIPQITPVSERSDALDLRLLARGGGGGTSTPVAVPALEASSFGSSSNNNGNSAVMSPQSTTAAATAPQPLKKPNFIQSKLNDWGAALVGRAIRGLYSNLGQQGFSPGEEFVTAVKEGQAIGRYALFMHSIYRGVAHFIHRTHLSIYSLSLISI